MQTEEQMQAEIDRLNQIAMRQRVAIWSAAACTTSGIIGGLTARAVISGSATIGTVLAAFGLILLTSILPELAMRGAK